MRTPIIAVSLLGAAVLSPTFAAPTHRKPESHSNHHQLSNGDVQAAGLLSSRNLSDLGHGELFSRDYASSRDASTSWYIMPREFWKKVNSTASLRKRLSDEQTKGGNAHSGNSGAVNGGSVINTDPTNNQGMPVLMNVNSNNAGLGGQSTTGCATSGHGSKVGIGGNASSGNSGKAEGGSVEGSPSGMINMDSNNAGTAGESATGCATGGDTSGREVEVGEELARVAEEEDHIPFSNEQ